MPATREQTVFGPQSDVAADVKLPQAVISGESRAFLNTIGGRLYADDDDDVEMTICVFCGSSRWRARILRRGISCGKL